MDSAFDLAWDHEVGKLYIYMYVSVHTIRIFQAVRLGSLVFQRLASVMSQLINKIELLLLMTINTIY